MLDTRKLFPLLVALGITWQSAIAQDFCGQFVTAPSSTAVYSFDPSGSGTTIPVDATFDISCDDYSLNAILGAHLIGADENGDDIFAGLLHDFYPLSVNSPLQHATYQGRLPATQYYYDWTFELLPDESVSWSGSVHWIGGRFENMDIVRVQLVPVPEPTQSWCYMAGVLLVLMNKRKANRATTT